MPVGAEEYAAAGDRSLLKSAFMGGSGRHRHRARSETRRQSAKLEGQA